MTAANRVTTVAATIVQRLTPFTLTPFPEPGSSLP